METKNTRIRNVRLRLGLNQTDFAYRIGLAQTTLSCIENNVASVSKRVQNDICREYKVRQKWIECGEGDMFEPEREANDEDFIQILYKCYKSLNEDEQKAIVKLIKSVREYKIK